jgi:hypothetical protein
VIAAFFCPCAPYALTSHVSVFSHYFKRLDRFAKLATSSVIDFEDLDILSARRYESLFRRIEKMVLPDRKEAARIEEERNAEALKENPKAKVTRDHANALKRWWQLFRSRQEMVKLISELPRYISPFAVQKVQKRNFQGGLNFGSTVL